MSEVRSILHDAHINLARPVVVRSSSIEVRPLQDNFAAALAKLRKLSQEFNGVRAVEVTNGGGRLIRLPPTDAGVAKYEPPMIAQSIAIIRARLSVFPAASERIPATVEREGAHRLRVQVSKLGPEEIGTPTAHAREPQAPYQPVPQTEVGKKEKGPARRAPVLRPRSRPLVRLTRSTSLPRAHTGVADAAGRSVGHLH